MKKIFFIIVWIIPMITFSQHWHWAKGINGDGFDIGNSIAVDKFSNIYQAGSFGSDSIIFGAYTLKNHWTHDNNGNFGNTFLVKYNSSGNVLWTSGSSSGHAGANAVAVDNAGNPIIVGCFSSSKVVFGHDTLTQDTTNNQNQPSSIFLIKYDTLGNVIWARGSKSQRQDACFSVATDNINNIYITGVFVSPQIIFENVTLYNSGGTAMFLAKYNASGNLLWVKKNDNTEAKGVAIDSYGNIIVTGDYVQTSAVFDTDVFITKYDSSGNVIWTKSYGGTQNDVSMSVAADNFGNSYITGYYGENISFGSYSLTLNPSGLPDIFLAKFDLLGNVTWAKGMGSNYGDLGYSVATDIKGNVYLKSGVQGDSISFDSIYLSLPPSGHYYTCLAKFDSLGKAVCATSLPVGGNEWTKMTVDTSGNTYFGGYFDSDTFIIGEDTLYKGTGYGNIFITKVSLDDCTQSATCIAFVTDSIFNISPGNWEILPHYSPYITSATWYWGDGTSSTGLYPSHTYSVAGMYNICVTAYTLCGDSASFCNSDSLYRISSSNVMINVNVISETSGVSQSTNKNHLSIYPNPASTTLYVSGIKSQTEIQVYDVLGNIVLRGANPKLDISNLQSGVYFVRVGNVAQKFVKQ